MKIKHRQVPFKVKAVDDKKGAIKGYGSVFNNADQYRDVVMPGAFQKSLAQYKANDESPVMLWQHNSDQPIGVWTDMEEDDTGLAVEGMLLIDDVAQAAESYALLKAGAIKGMSIGYNVPDGGMEYDGKTNVWKLNQVDLWEISIVTFPANTEASVTNIKSILDTGGIPSVREFENILRDVGYSRKHARAIASMGYADFLAQRDADEEDPDQADCLKSVLALIQNHPITI